MSLDAVQVCQEMVRAAEDDRLSIVYWPRFREFGALYNDTSIQVFRFCPFCGEPLPPSLREVLYRKLGDEGVDALDLPPDSPYLSDEWWIAGGL